jgi:DNA-binding MarR family transcriptional regulator
MKPMAKLAPEKAQLFLALLHQLQRVDPEFPLHYSICLMQVALNEGLSLTMLAERTQLALSTVSRIVAALSEHRQQGQAYGLIEIKISPEERRRKELYLTPKGWMVVKSVMGVLDNYNPGLQAQSGVA